MRTPYHGRFDPFVLRSNRIFFHDWRYVDHGTPRWELPTGEYLGLWSGGPLPPLRWHGRNVPWGITLRAISAQKSEPFIGCDRPWEGILFGATVIQEDGKYRLWYESVPPAHIHEGRAGSDNLLCYAESEDGHHWIKPALSLCAYEGHAETNIVFGGPLSPAHGYHGGNVFVDPRARPEERFKAFHLGFMDRQAAEGFLRRHPQEVDPHNQRTAQLNALFGAVSPDGLHWRPLPDPLVFQVSDTHNIAYYDTFLDKYVAYMRTWVMGRRAIGRSESPDFSHFPLPETFLWPDASVGPTDTWYCNGKTVYPGTDDYHLLFAKRWCIAEDRFSMHLATSPDGILWGFPPASEVLTVGDRESWDAGGVSAGCGMIELPDGHIAVPYTGDAIPHKYTRHPPLGALAWAHWQPGRLVALEAPERGEFCTSRVIFRGRQLSLNVRTKQVGEVRVEVLDLQGEPIPGYTLADCDPINGDESDHRVTWRGECIIPRQDDEPRAFRISLAAAELFALAFS